MNCREPFGDLPGNPNDVIYRQLADSRQPLVERFALEQLHYQKWNAVLTDLVQAHDVSVYACRGNPSFAEESHPGRVAVRQRRLHDLESYDALKLQVLCSKDNSHGSGSKEI